MSGTEPNGAIAGDGRLKAGQRILEVNRQSLLGGCHQEAVQSLLSVKDKLVIIICDGFDAVLILGRSPSSPSTPGHCPSSPLTKPDEIYNPTEPLQEPFFIQSNLNQLVLEVHDARMKAGTHVKTQLRKGSREQQWRIDADTGTIRTSLNDFCLDIEGGKLVINPYEAGKDDQKWGLAGTTIVNSYDRKVLQADGDYPGAPVTSTFPTGHAKQSWSFQPAD